MIILFTNASMCVCIQTQSEVLFFIVNANPRQSSRMINCDMAN